MKPRKKLGPPPHGAPFEIPLADISHIKRKWLDLPYASLSPTQKLDIYLPDEGDGPFPVILHIHGEVLRSAINAIFTFWLIL